MRPRDVFSLALTKAGPTRATLPPKRRRHAPRKQSPSEARLRSQSDVEIDARSRHNRQVIERPASLSYLLLHRNHEPKLRVAEPLRIRALRSTLSETRRRPYHLGALEAALQLHSPWRRSHNTQGLAAWRPGQRATALDCLAPPARPPRARPPRQKLSIDECRVRSPARPPSPPGPRSGAEAGERPPRPQWFHQRPLGASTRRAAERL